MPRRLVVLAAGLTLSAASALAQGQPQARTQAQIRSFMATGVPSAPTPTAFADSNGLLPAGYKGPVFKLSHEYPPTAVPPKSFPWRTAIGNGPITVTNAGVYVEALKNYVAPSMRLMLTDSPQWNAARLGWYGEPWTGYLREATHGVYVGSSPFPPELFKGSGLTKPFTTYVLTFYDRTAGNTLYKIWGKSAQKPTIQTGAAQFADGAVIVKAAFSTANADVWPVMQGAKEWQVYISTNATKHPNPSPVPEMDTVSFFQFDIIVKDPQSAPKSGWVFSTLVYDKDAPGNDFWDKMVPLGAQWGNDPDVDSTKNPNQPLTENWINPAAPAYSKMTLGWGGRLSGPNDGAVNNAVIDASPAPQVAPGLASSSCMSCHSVAEWPMKSFLLPSGAPGSFAPEGFSNSDYLVMWPPGSKEWMHWFQSRPGDQPADAGTAAFDYDMVTTFKSLNAWASVQGGHAGTMAVVGGPRTRPGSERAGGSYSGRPFGAR
jgi:hypothetical protein